MKRVYCLYRVSTKGQVDGDDIPMQRIACHAFAEQQGWSIVQEHSEKGVSGYKVSSEKRDAVQSIKVDAAKGLFDVLLVFMFDRLGRRDDETPFVVQWFVSKGVEVWSVKEGQQKFENHVDKLLNYIRFWQASGESEKTSMRIKTRHAQMVMEGLYRGGVQPYGYKLVPNGRVNKKGHPLHDLAIDPIHAPIVEEIFMKTCHEGYGTHRLANYLNEVYPDDRKGWRPTTLNRIICNPVYTGRMRFNDTMPIQYETLRIVDDTLFERANYILHQRATCNSSTRSIPQQTNGARLLTGFLYCEHCGERMVGTVSRDKRIRKKTGDLYVKERPIYRCYGRDIHARGCQGQSMYSALKIETAVLNTVNNVFAKIQDQPEQHLTDQCLDRETQAMKVRFETARGAVVKMERQYENLQNELLKSINGEVNLDRDLLGSLITRTQISLQQAKKDAAEAEQTMRDIGSRKSAIKETYQNFLGWKHEFENASLPIRKMILSSLVDRITVDKFYNITVKLNLSANQFVEGL